MQFSKRTEWNTEESELARAHRLRVQAGLPIADLTASNPTRSGFEYDSKLLAALADARALDYDPQPRGMLRAREAVCAYYADHAVKVGPEQVVLTTSTSEAYSFLLRLLCDPGNEILVPQPGYPLFDYLAGLDDVRLKAAPLVYDYGWQMDPEGFRRAITPETRAIVLVHPNNPTGHFSKDWEAIELARLCREHGLALIVDEVFLDYKLAGEMAGAHASFAQGLDDVPVFVVSGLSKIAGLPQMKAAWIVATGPGRRDALDRLEVIADTFLSMNAPVQCAMPVWLEGHGKIQRQISGAGRGEPGGTGPGSGRAGGDSAAGVGGRLVCSAADSRGAAGPEDSVGVAGAGCLGASRVLLRDEGVWLAGGEPAGGEGGVQRRSILAWGVL